jgi:hypothetical protein
MMPRIERIERKNYLFYISKGKDRILIYGRSYIFVFPQNLSKIVVIFAAFRKIFRDKPKKSLNRIFSQIYENKNLRFNSLFTTLMAPTLKNTAFGPHTD